MPKPSAHIAKLKFSGGSTFTLNPDEKIIIVGPNNSGKSQTLREILAICQNGEKERPTVLAGIEIKKSGSREDLQRFMEANAIRVDGNFRYKNWQLPEHHLGFWDQDYLIHGLSTGFIKKIAADDRLNICQQQNSVSPEDQKSKPQHVLYDDQSLMNRISELFRRAFGDDLMFDFRGGNRLPIHIGQTPHMPGSGDRVGDVYVEAVRKNPLLDKQGDGMKSYAGILFEAVVTDRDITLIDEPEAFLHPPQMRRLGETLSSEVGGQLIVATHSSDIMRGFLEGTRGNVRILRIRREGDTNLVSEASSSVIKDLWEKPELRYSNALEGIFHEQVIICEDDSDCRLINSVADHLSTNSDEQWKDTAYVPTGGKHGVPKVAEALRKIGVPVKAVFDIDFLSELHLVESTVKAFGGEWNEVEPLWARVDSAVRNGVLANTADQIKEEIFALLRDSEEGKLPKSGIINAMKQNTPWATVKKFGEVAIPKGDALRDYRSLRTTLEQVGIFIIPAGEIENFCPEVGSHGPKFVTKLLSTIPLDHADLYGLRNFVTRVHKGNHGKIDSGNVVEECDVEDAPPAQIA